MTDDDDLPARYRAAWAEAYAKDRAERSHGRRRLAAATVVWLLAGTFLTLSALFLRAALHDAPAADLAWAIITGIAK